MSNIEIRYDDQNNVDLTYYVTRHDAHSEVSNVTCETAEKRAREGVHPTPSPPPLSDGWLWGCNTELMVRTE